MNKFYLENRKRVLENQLDDCRNNKNISRFAQQFNIEKIKQEIDLIEQGVNAWSDWYMDEEYLQEVI